MFGLSLVTFVGLIAWGPELLGLPHGGHLQIGLVMCFLSGIMCGYKFKS